MSPMSMQSGSFKTLATSCLASALSIVCLSIAVAEPLVTVIGYDLHLFPRNDAVRYEVSRTHHASQVFHCLALAAFCACFGAALGMLLVLDGLSERTQRNGTAVIAMLAATGAVAHAAALGSIFHVALQWKDTLERIPVPIPDVQAQMRAGIYMDVVCLIPSLTAAILTAKVAARSYRERYVSLE